MILLTEELNSYLFAYAIGGFISLFLLGCTIAIAVGVNRRDRHNKIVINILAAIAEKHGVDSEKLIKLLKEAEK